MPELVLGPSTRCCACTCHDEVSSIDGPPAAPAHPASFVGDTLEDLEAEMNKLQLVLVGLKKRRNALLPVSRLPTELFNRVFAFCIPPARQSLRRNGDETKWFPFSLVCHAWRAIALSCPSLWTRPWFIFPKLANIMLQRSQPMRLHIVGDFYGIVGGTDDFTAAYDSVLSSAIAQADRIQTMDILARMSRFRILASAELARSFPKLESLALELEGDDKNADIPPIVILRDTAPRLQYLRLSGFPIPWQSPTLRQLSTLLLRDCRQRRLAVWTDIFDALRGMESLESLALDDSLPLRAPASLQGDLIDLPRLIHLHVRDEQDPLVTFIQSVVLSPSLHLSVVLTHSCQWGRPVTEQTLLAIRSVLSSFLSASDQYCPLVCLALWTNCRLCAWTTTDTDSEPKLCLINRTAANVVEALMTSAVSPLWSSNIQTLLVGDGSDYNYLKVPWSALFSLTRNARTVKVWSSATVPLIHALLDNAVTAVRAEHVLLPSLRTLTLDVSLHVLQESKIEMARDLAFVLRHRGAFGLQLDELHCAHGIIEFLTKPMEGVGAIVEDETTGDGTPVPASWEEMLRRPRDLLPALWRVGRREEVQMKGS